MRFTTIMKNFECHDEETEFNSVSEEIVAYEKLGPDLPVSLAFLADKMLSMKIDAIDKDKYEKYPRPNNVEFLLTPQVNEPVWSNLSYPVEIIDSQLQNIQKEFLSSAVPTLQVMKMLNDAKDDLNQLDVKEVLRILSDGLAFFELCQWWFGSET